MSPRDNKAGKWNLIAILDTQNNEVARNPTCNINDMKLVHFLSQSLSSCIFRYAPKRLVEKQ